MLTTTKNTLLNKLLRLELEINEALKPYIEYEINDSQYYVDIKASLIISRNIESIKKQLKKL